MKRFLLGALIGLLIGWLTVPLVRAGDDDSPRRYKDYLNQMLNTMKTMNQHLQNIEENTKAVKDKLHA